MLWVTCCWLLEQISRVSGNYAIRLQMGYCSAVKTGKNCAALGGTLVSYYSVGKVCPGPQRSQPCLNRWNVGDDRLRFEEGLNRRYNILIGIAIGAFQHPCALAQNGRWHGNDGRPLQQGLGDGGLVWIILNQNTQQDIGINSEPHRSPAHPAAVASLICSMERRGPFGRFNNPKTADIGVPSPDRSCMRPPLSKSTSSLSPGFTPRCFNTSLRRVICPLLVTVSLIVMAASN